jgi:hypothetical protein
VWTKETANRLCSQLPAGIFPTRNIQQQPFLTKFPAAAQMTFTQADRLAGKAHPMLEVHRVALNDGLHASLILENGRISKLVSPSGEVAVLCWEAEKHGACDLAKPAECTAPANSPVKCDFNLKLLAISTASSAQSGQLMCLCF